MVMGKEKERDKELGGPETEVARGGFRCGCGADRRCSVVAGGEGNEGRMS